MARNGISAEALKADRQARKLNLAQAKKQGYEITVANEIDMSNGIYTGTPDETQVYYRGANQYDINELPTKYGADNQPSSLIDNPNIYGLLPKRPWINVGSVSAPRSPYEAVASLTQLAFVNWMDSSRKDNIDGTAADESVVNRWIDQSAFKLDLVSLNLPPTFESTLLQNNNGYIEFTGTEDLTRTTAPTSTSVFSLIMVVNITNTTGTRYLIDTSTQDFGIVVTNGSVGLTMNTGSGTTDATVTQGQWQIHTLIYNGSSIVYRLDKTAATVSISVPASTGLVEDFHVGINNTYTNGLVGYVGEILIFQTALPATQYENLENYLNYKWGLGL